MNDDDTHTICRTVADLIVELSKLPPETIPTSHEPPFTGVKVVPQEGRGKVFIASLWNTDEGRTERATAKAAMRAA